MNILHLLKQDILNASLKYTNDECILQNIAIEIPKYDVYGDLSSNAAMIIASKTNANPREVAKILKKELECLPYITNIDIAGPGFINFTIQEKLWHESLAEILKQKSNYGSCDIGNKVKVNIEYVSANPTGPMHIGHARGAVYGDALARLMSKCGYDVTKEYYVNDAGAQISVLAESVFLRYMEIATGEVAEIGSGLYPGEYLVPVARKLFEQYGEKLTSMDKDERLKIIKIFAISEMLELIRCDLSNLGIAHDIFTSEQSLYDRNIADNAISELDALGLLYTGTLPPPKTVTGDNHISGPQLLFKSTNFGDDQDRAVKKSDNSLTYFAGDIAYASDKISRGFQKLILVLGADHIGYVKRLSAITQALGGNKVASEVRICQMVNYIEDGKSVKMSKRAGSFSTVADVINAVGKDVIRFMMLTRKNDAALDFDLAKVMEQSKDNPVFYVQYAYVRAGSIIENAQKIMSQNISMLCCNMVDFSALKTKEEMHLLKQLVFWTKTIETAAISFEPHHIAIYLQNIAGIFHSLWNLGKENNDYRFIIDDNPDLTSARIALVTAMRYVIESGFDIMGVDAMQKM